MKAAKLSRLLHRWGSLAVALPICIIIVAGIMLQLKKDFAWIQPPTRSGSSQSMLLSFDRILEVAKTVPEAGITGWDDVDRLDVRPSIGMLKVQGKNRWEVQIDTKTGDVMQVAHRRSDLIEDIRVVRIEGRLELTIRLQDRTAMDEYRRRSGPDRDDRRSPGIHHRRTECLHERSEFLHRSGELEAL